MHTQFIAACCALLLTLSVSTAQNTTDELMQTPQTFKKKITRTIGADYLLFLPKGYETKGVRSRAQQAAMN